MEKVEKLKKKDINSYIEFIKEIFDYDATIENIEKMMRKNIILVIKDNNKVVASATLTEGFEYIKNKKYYKVNYLGVLKDYRREGYATNLLK